MITRSRVMGALMLAVTVGCSGAPASSPSPTNLPTASPTTTPAGSPTSPPTASPSPTPPPTPSPTPAPETLTFDDGALTIEVPYGAMPEGVELTAIQRGAEDAPPELAELEFRGSFYSLEPDGLTFAQPLRVTRRVPVTGLGLDVDELGMPIVNLALRTSDGSWSWLPNQSQIMDEEYLYVSGDLTHTSTLVGFGGNHFARLEPPPGGFSWPTMTRFTPVVTVIGPIDAPEPPQVGPPGEPFTHTGVIAHDPIFFTSPDWGQLPPLDRFDAMPTVSQPLECQQPGMFNTIIGYETVQAPGNFFYSHLNLDPPSTTVLFELVLECLDAATSPSPNNAVPAPTAACVIVVHTPMGTFISHLRMLVAFDLPVERLEMTIQGAHDGEPVVGEIVSDFTHEFLFGLRGAGMKRVEKATLTTLDGRELDITSAIGEWLGGLRFNVPYPGEPTFGSCPE